MSSASSTQLLDLVRENERLKQEVAALHALVDSYCAQLDHPNREGTSMGWCYCERFCYSLTLGPGLLLPVLDRIDMRAEDLRP